MNNNYNSRSMNGLNNINANSLNSDEIDVDTLVVNLSATVPTMPTIDNSLHVANTSFVQSVVNGLSISNYVTLNTVQTITAEKTFLENVNMTSGLLGNYINASSSLDTPAIGSGLGTDDLTIGYNQTSGDLNLGCRNNRTGQINIGTLTTGNAPITIGSTSSTTQTATHNAITTFNKIPYCSIAPTLSGHLVNKGYVDTEILGGLSGYVDTTSAQTITGSKTFSGTSTFDGLVNVTGATAGNINLTVNTPASNNIFFNFGNPTVSARIRTHYINALNRVSMNVDTTGKEFSLGVNTNDYIIFKPSTSSTDIASNLNLTGSLFMQPGMAFSFIPIGTINTSVVATVPTGFLYCDGSAVSRSIYAGLFLAIGTTYGAGDGSTSFNLPNFKGCFLRGSGTQNIGGVSYSSGSVGTAQQDAVMNPIYSSNEGFRDCAAGSRECVARFRITGDPVDTTTGILGRFPRQADENRPVNHAVYYYIKF